jgi:6-phosphofructokinase 1
MRRIGILTSGGDAPGMNACIRAAVRTALAHDLTILGIRRGYTGLIAGDAVPLERPAIRNTIHQGGTILETSRNPEFYTKEGRLRAAAAIQEMDLDGLVLIGGEGTFHGASLLAAETDPAALVGVPGSIDNDVYGTDYCIGFDTAANCAVEAIDRIRDTARSHERLFFIEVMGTDGGVPGARERYRRRRRGTGHPGGGTLDRPDKRAHTRGVHHREEERDRGGGGGEDTGHLV